MSNEILTRVVVDWGIGIVILLIAYFYFLSTFKKFAVILDLMLYHGKSQHIIFHEKVAFVRQNFKTKSIAFHLNNYENFFMKYLSKASYSSESCLCDKERRLIDALIYEMN